MSRKRLLFLGLLILFSTAVIGCGESTQSPTTPPVPTESATPTAEPTASPTPTAKPTNDPNPPFEPGFYELSLEFDGVTRWFLLDVPNRYDGDTAVPLILVFHGGGGSAKGTRQARSDLRASAQQENIVLAFVNGFNGSDNNSGGSTWNAVHCCGLAFSAGLDDVSLVRTIVEMIQTSLNIDERRIYATGFSNGGMLTHRLGAELPEIFAAVAPIGATVGGEAEAGQPLTTIEPDTPMPVIMIHGGDDPAVPVLGGIGRHPTRTYVSFAESVALWAEANGCKGSPEREQVTGRKGPVNIGTHSNCTGADVTGIVIQGFKHLWPSLEESGYDGTAAILDFFKSHSK